MTRKLFIPLLLIFSSLFAYAGQETTKPGWQYMGRGTETMEQFTASFGKVQISAKQLSAPQVNVSDVLDARAALTVFHTQREVTKQFARNLRTEATRTFKAGTISAEEYERFVREAVHLEYIVGDSQRILKNTGAEAKIAHARPFNRT